MTGTMVREDCEEDSLHAVTAGDQEDLDEPEEEEDSFPILDHVPLFDPASLRRISDTHSVATTADIASSVGSVVGPAKPAFLKSFTVFRPTSERDGDQSSWAQSMELTSTTVRTGGLRGRQVRLSFSSVSGLLASSRIIEGDFLRSINQRRVGGASWTAQKAMDTMSRCWQNDGYLSLSTKNKDEDRDDILVHATIVKPRPDMTYKEMGMIVWMWGYLCIKEIPKTSIFKHTALKETDNIVSVNEILCDRIDPEQFAEILTRLDREITITVLRRKERMTGKFG